MPVSADLIVLTFAIFQPLRVELVDLGLRLFVYLRVFGLRSTYYTLTLIGATFLKPVAPRGGVRHTITCILQSSFSGVFDHLEQP